MGMTIQKAVTVVTVVTGAGRGIGGATAVHLARRGHDLCPWLLQRGGECERGPGAVRAEGARAVLVRGDVSDDGNVDALFAAAWCRNRIPI